MEDRKSVRPIGEGLKSGLESIQKDHPSDRDVDAHIEAERERERARRFQDIWGSFGEPRLRRHKALADDVSTCLPDSDWSAAYLVAAGAATMGTSVTIAGPRGTGKTAIAVCVARLFCHKGKRPVYLTAWDLFVRFKATYGEGALSELQLMDKFGKAPLLILDEIHERGETGWEDRTLVTLIDYRYGAMLPTILLTNQMPDALAKSLGPSICDRLREAGTVLEATWPSFRAKEGGG